MTAVVEQCMQAWLSVSSVSAGSVLDGSKAAAPECARAPTLYISVCVPYLQGWQLSQAKMS